MTPDEMRAIAKALRRMRESGQYTMGGATLGSDGSFSSWGGEPIMVLANPDGPKAADAILGMLDEQAAMEARIARLENSVSDLLGCFSIEGKHLAPAQGGNFRQEAVVREARAALADQPAKPYTGDE